MEGGRHWEFTAPAFACPGGVQPSQATADAHYFPAGWRRGRRRKGHAKNKRHKGEESTPLAHPPAALSLPANPAQLVPLRCSWPHPAVVDLVAQQCWPAAGAAALGGLPGCITGPARLAPPSAHQLPTLWNRMLPSLSLVHAPLTSQQQTLVAAASTSASIGSGSNLQALQLPRPTILVGYEDDWLEVAAEVLPLWPATPLAPFAGPKPLLHYLVCPQQQLRQAEQFVKDVGSLYETCNLGSHQPASDALTCAIRDSAESSASTPQARYLAGLRDACEQLQRQLLLEPPEELQQCASLECGSELSLVVYVVCPFSDQRQQVAALLEAASCLAPCTHLGADLGSGDGLALLPQTSSQLKLVCGEQALAPSEPQPPDRPAGATPALDTSRAPGASLPPDEAQQAPQQEAQQQEQQRYHGAALVLHQQQCGDFRQVPLRLLRRPDGRLPLRLAIQVVTPEALADISGTASRCTALAVYSKVQYDPQDSQGQLLQPPAGARLAPSLPFCSQPLLVLQQAATVGDQDAQHTASHQQQQGQQDEGVQRDGEGLEPAAPASLPPRTLHCFYVLPAAGSTMLPLAFTDSCGELLHAEVLDTAAAAMGTAATSSLLGAAGDDASAAFLACHLVLRRSLEVFNALRAACTPPGLLHGIAIASTSMGQQERQAWQQLLEDPGLQLELVPATELAVVELDAPPPARFAGPDPPTGCRLVVPCMPGGGGVEHTPSATVVWLPTTGQAASLLPHEHEAVRMLHVSLVASCPSHTHPHSRTLSLQSLAGELHGLAWLHAAFQGACLQAPSGSGQAAPPEAHIPLHASLAQRLQSLISAIESPEPSAL